MLKSLNHKRFGNPATAAGIVVFSAILLFSAGRVEAGLSPLRKKFAEFPKAGLDQVPVLPTPNENIFSDDMKGFVARTSGNDNYGMPGWSRNFGRRFHKGVDILPTKWTTTDEKIKMEYVSTKTGRSITRIEEVRIPKDEIFAILDGKVVVENTIESRSGYGKYVILEHRWADGTPFLSMYCHLSRVTVDQGNFVKRGSQIGIMGQTSSNSGGRRFLKVIPHMHLEVGRVIDDNFANTATSRGLRPKNFSGKYDPRNMQPYDPIKFLKKFRAITYAEFRKEMDDRAGSDKRAAATLDRESPAALGVSSLGSRKSPPISGRFLSNAVRFFYRFYL